MDLDDLSKDERNDVLARMADLYYNQQMTQIDIAKRYDTTRFKVAKMLQEARDAQIVEIKVNYSSERNHTLERQLAEAFGLDGAIVVDTKYATFIDGLRDLGKMGAIRVNELLMSRESTTLGLTWGKSIQSVIEQLPRTARTDISAVQLAGNFDSARPTSESREVVRAAAASFLGTPYYLNAPLYVRDDATRAGLRREPDLARTFAKAKALDVVLTGVGAASSLPNVIPTLAPYLADDDRKALETCKGSIFGYILDGAGEVARTRLNSWLMAAPLEDVLAAPHRICVVHGRNKVPVATIVARAGLVNELVTDAETAALMLELV